jgi:hypothetical protein
MKKIILMTIILVGMLIADGSKVHQVRHIDWVRMELVAMYGGYYLGNQDLYLSIYNTDNKNTIKVVMYWSRRLSNDEVFKLKNNLLNMLDAYRVNSSIDDWLQFTFENRYLKKL